VRADSGVAKVCNAAEIAFFIAGALYGAGAEDVNALTCDTADDGRTVRIAIVVMRVMDCGSSGECCAGRSWKTMSCAWAERGREINPMKHWSYMGEIVSTAS